MEPLSPVPLNEPGPENVIDSVSVAPAFVSPIVTPENGSIGVSEVVVWPGTVPVIVGATRDRCR